MRMIIASDEVLHVGQVTCDMSDHLGNAHEHQVFKVVRPSNANEYLKYNLAKGANPEMARYAAGFFYLFYEVQTD
jgi:hypothetical protein